MYGSNKQLTIWGHEDTFTLSSFREIGRIYGKAISQGMLGNKYASMTIIAAELGASKGKRIYHRNLDKLINGWPFIEVILSYSSSS